MRWKIVPREKSEEDTSQSEDEEDEVRRLSEFCCETLHLGGCRKGEEGEINGLATDTLPNADSTHAKEVQKVRIRATHSNIIVCHHLYL